MKPGSFNVLAKMAELERDVRLAPLSNIIRARATKTGTEITIGFAGNVCNGILLGQFVGGFILASKDEFLRTKKEMTAEAVATDKQQINAEAARKDGAA